MLTSLRHRHASQDLYRWGKSRITCGICQDPLRSPRTLPCSHTFCLACLRASNGDRERTKALCPQCYSTYTLPTHGFDGLPMNFQAEILVGEIGQRDTFIDDVKSNRSVKCSACEGIVITDGLPSFFAFAPFSLPSGGAYCHQCDIVLCHYCRSHHSIVIAGQRHPVKPFKDRKELASMLIDPCSTHPGSQMRYYCYECSTVCCGRCIMSDHFGHPYADIRDASTSLWNRLSRALMRLNELRGQAKEEMKKFQERRETLLSIEERISGNGLKNWLKRKLFPVDDSESVEDEGQQEAKRARLEEIHNMEQGVVSMTKQNADLRTYSKKINDMTPNAVSSEAVAAYTSSIDECEKLIAEATLELQERKREIISLQAQQDQQGNIGGQGQGQGLVNPLAHGEPSNGSSPSIQPAVADLPILERCLTMLVEYGKCRFLWKVQVYSLDNPGNWKTINFAPSLSLRHTVPFIHSDTIYAIGTGRQNGDLWEYSPFAPRWTRRTNLPESMKGCGVVVIDQDMLLFGGSQNSAGPPSSRVHCFNLENNTWTRRNNMAAAVCDPMIMEYNGMLYLFGGRTGLHTKARTVQRYNLATGVCTTVADMPCRGKFHGFRSQNWGIFIGRVSGCLYNFDTDVWYPRQRFKSQMYYSSIALIDDIIHMVGGRTKGKEAWRNVDILALPLAAFIEDSPEVEWTLRKTLQPNTIRRRQRYTAATDGLLNMSFP